MFNFLSIFIFSFLIIYIFLFLKGMLIGDEIYCTSKLYRDAEESNSATKAVRRLLEGVFKLQSLLECTVSGYPPRGKGREAYAGQVDSVKNFLTPAGVDAIIGKFRMCSVLFIVGK